MTFRSLVITCFTLLAALTLCAANGPQTQATTAADVSQSARRSVLLNLPRVAQQTTPVEPTLAEMRTMTAEQLDEAGDQLRQAKEYFAAVDCYRAAIRKHAVAAYYNKIAISELLLSNPMEAGKVRKKSGTEGQASGGSLEQSGGELLHAEEVERCDPYLPTCHLAQAGLCLISQQPGRSSDGFKAVRTSESRSIEGPSNSIPHSSTMRRRTGSARTWDRHRIAHSFPLSWPGCLPETETLIARCTSCAAQSKTVIRQSTRYIATRNSRKLRNDERFLALMKEHPVGDPVKCSRYSAGTGEEPSRTGWPARRLRSSR